MKNVCTVVLVMLIYVAVCVGRGEAKDADGPPNVVFLLVDDLGWTDVACFGSDLHETPNIDALCARGTKFTSGYAACTVCSPTRAAYMTGKYPARLHLTDWIAGHARKNAKLQIPNWQKWMGHPEVTLAEALKSAGYATCHVGKWHLAKRGEDVAQYYPQRHGFDRNIGGTSWGAPGSYFHPFRRKGQGGEPRVNALPDSKPGDYLTDHLTDQALEFIDENKDRPFFLSIPYYNVHTPIQGKQEYVEKYRAKIKPGMRHDNATYAAMVHSVDDSVGRLVARLKELGLDQKTVIFFTGDNGGLSRVTNNKPLRAGKGSSYEGGVRVPTMACWPGITKPGSVCDEPIITMDFYPTILAMAGAPGAAGHNANVDGQNIMPLLKDPSARLDREAIYWHYPHYHPGGASPYAAIRERDWKLIEFFEDDHVELYNLNDDIGESKDLAKTNAVKARELRDKLHAWRAAVDAQMPTANPNYKPNVRAAPKKKRKSNA